MYIPTSEHAASIRADIKAAIKSGALPAGTKVSVKTSTYSMGSSINVRVTALPSGFVVLNPERVVFEHENPKRTYFDLPESAREQLSVEARAVEAELNRIVDTYHVDRSYESGADMIYNCNFHKHIGFDCDLRSACRARTVANHEAGKAVAALRAEGVIKPRI